MLDTLIESNRLRIDELGHPSVFQTTKDLASYITEIVQQILAIQDHHVNLLSEHQEPELRASSYAILFDWMVVARDYALLWRDVTFEYQKAYLLHRHTHADPSLLQDLHEATRSRLHEATDDLRERYQLSAGYTLNGRNSISTYDQWEDLIRPTDIYKSQLNSINSQAKAFVEELGQLDQVGQQLQAIKETVQAEILSLHRDLQNLLDTTQKAMDFIDTDDTYPGKIEQQLLSLEQAAPQSRSIQQYQESIDQLLAPIKSIVRVPIATQGGQIIYRDINFGRRIGQWLDNEIQPNVYEMVEIVDQAIGSANMALINVRNRATIIEGDQKLQTLEQLNSLSQPLRALEPAIQSWQTNLQGLRQTIDHRINKDLDIGTVYDRREVFLPVPLQRSITQLRLEQNEVLVRVKSWVQDQTSYLKELKGRLLKEESLSKADKIVRYTKSRQITTNRHHYDSIFRAPGFIGDSFCVGRQSELDRIADSISSWNAGFRGSAILHGIRHSGKTLLGELISHRYFIRSSISVKPTIPVNIDGRREAFGYDLNKALQFIKKHSLNKRYLVWIDDIESWGSDEHTLGYNLRSLVRYVDELSGRLFFLVSINTWSRSHWNNVVALDQVFQSQIECGPMSTSDVRQAILIRHGATHKKLVSDTGQEVTSPQFSRMIQRVHSMAGGVIGDALHLWANGTNGHEEEDKVTFEKPVSYGLPDFLTPDQAILLRSILYQRTTSEYRLSKVFGPVFKERYSALVHRFLLTGILVRRLDGMIEIAPGIVNDIARLLSSHQYIGDITL